MNLTDWETVEDYSQNAHTPAHVSCSVKNPFVPQLHSFRQSLCNCHQIWGKNEPEKGLMSLKPVSEGWVFFFASSRLLSCGDGRVIFMWCCMSILEQTENKQTEVCRANISQKQSCFGGRVNSVVGLQHWHSIILNMLNNGRQRYRRHITFCILLDPICLSNDFPISRVSTLQRYKRHLFGDDDTMLLLYWCHIKNCNRLSNCPQQHPVP